MQYDAFDPAYEQTQVERLIKSLEGLRQRSGSPGRTVPEEESLVIGTGRRLPMAVMFLDICGFSGRGSETELEQDTILRAMNLFFSEMVRIAEDYGGTVEKNTGDGLMAYFEDGGGQPQQCGSKRAVACSLTMFRTTTRLLNPLLERSVIPPLDFRIGIDHGIVTVARIGPPRRFNALVAIGTAANVACKMLRFAGPNEIVIGDCVKYTLPLAWTPFITKLTDNSGWVYRGSGLPYPFYRYTGRWKT